MPKTPDQKMESLERGLRLWKLLAYSLIVLFFVSNRHGIVGFIDRAGGWMTTVAQASAEPIRD